MAHGIGLGVGLAFLLFSCVACDSTQDGGGRGGMTGAGGGAGTSSSSSVGSGGGGAAAGTLLYGAASPACIRGIAVDATYLYWAGSEDCLSPEVDAGFVMRCPKDDCASDVVTLASSLLPPRQIRTDGERLFWIGDDLAGSCVMRCETAGCGG